MPSRDLTGGDWRKWSAVLTEVLAQANYDDDLRKPRRSGLYLRNLIVNKCRKSHIRLLSTVYNQMRDELDRVRKGQ